MTQRGLWSSGDAYERYTGRWSRNVASSFLAWIGAAPGASWIDVGCGTGALTSAVLADCEPIRIVGIDHSDVFLQVAQARIGDPQVTLRRGDAQAIPEADAACDVAVSGLVLNFVADKSAVLREMTRVVRPGGTVALYVWDYAAHMQIMRNFFDAAALDPIAVAFDDGINAPVCRPGPLRDLFADAGLAQVEVRALDIPAAFESFDDYLLPFLGGTRSAPKYCMSLEEGARQRLRSPPAKAADRP